VTPKPWYQSKTVVLNLVVCLIMALIAVLEVLQQADGALTTTTLIAAALAGLNVVLRFVTTQPIGTSDPAPPPAPPAPPQ
jgi:hypothetical protein